jgi:hypothetical protein
VILNSRAFAIVCIVFAASLGACGAAQHPQSTAADESWSTAVELELAQIAEVARFDAATAGTDACEMLCHHLEQICILGERICQLEPATADEIELMFGQLTICNDAWERCEATRKRLPPNCVCAG